MPTKRSIYGASHPQLVQLFETAGHPARGLCGPLDYAKAAHTALICNGLGDVLQGAFVVAHSPTGAQQLLDQVRQCARQRRIDSPHVFFGGADGPTYAENFVRWLREQPHLVVRVNAWEAKPHRSNFQASSDALDLLGMAKGLLNRRGEMLREVPAADANLRIVPRNRDELVRTRTATANRIYGYGDRLFPGFLDETQSGRRPFGVASLDLLAERFSPAQLGRRPQATLAAWLRPRGVPQPVEVARPLKELAHRGLGPSANEVGMLPHSLAQLVQLDRGLEASIPGLDRESADWWARPPGAFLTSIEGLGVTLASGGIAQLGPPAQWKAVRHLCSDAGGVPQLKQTGGPDQEPTVGRVQQRCNKRFKNLLLPAVEKLRQHGPEERCQTRSQLEARGAHAPEAMAKRWVRRGKYLAVTGTLYRPRRLMDPATPPAHLAAYYQSAWEKLVAQWREKAERKDAFAPAPPLGQWRQMAQELYALELRRPQQRLVAGPAR